MSTLSTYMRNIFITLFSVSLLGSGHLPKDFKFEKNDGTKRNPIINQLKRYEQCKGDEECIARLQSLEHSIRIDIFPGKVIIKHKNDVVRCDDAGITIENKDK